MYTVVASGIALALYAVAAIPLAFIVFSRHAGRVGMMYAAIVLGVVIYNTGLFSLGGLTRTSMVVPILSSGDDEQCRKVRDLLQQSGLRVDRSRSPATIVGVRADEIPPQVRDALLKCYKSQPAG